MAQTRILIVDDDASVSAALSAGLEQAGPYEVRVENDPFRAAAGAMEFGPDLILMDVIMPGKDGGTVASEIREHASLRAVPIIFLTSIVGKAEAAQTGGWIGDEPFMAKPVTLAELKSRIEATLQSKREN